jgi:ABC-type transport system involved in multi-copper enzyme maturation permease subunit
VTLHSKSYQPYAGELEPPRTRPWVIVRRELRLAVRKRWVRRLLFFALIPLAVTIVTLYFQLIVEKVTQAHVFGRNLYEGFYGVEVFFLVLMVAAAGSDLIAKDTASRAHQLYFSRPIRPIHYLLGKLGALFVVLFALLAPPGILLALANLLLASEPDYGGFASKVGELTVYGVVAALSAGVFISLLSAYGQRARYVGLFWVGIYFFSQVASGVLVERFHVDWARTLSLHNLLLDSGRFLYAEDSPGPLSLVVLVSLAAVAFLLTWRRVVLLERREA